MLNGLLMGWRQTDYLIWGLFAALVVCGWVVGLWVEYRHYQRQGKARSWKIMRLALLPFLAVVVAAVILPARWTHGPEALGVFYVGLLIVAPLLWWGLHHVLGQWISPALSRGESAGLAWMALGALLLPVLLANQLHGPLFALSEQWQTAQRRQALQAPLPLTITPPRRWTTNDQPLQTQSLFVNPGIVVEAIEYQQGNLWQDAARSIHPGFCASEGEVHFLTSEQHPAAPLRFYWRKEGSPLLQSTYYPPNGWHVEVMERPLHIQWRDDGVDFPVVLPRDAVLVAGKPLSGLPSFRLMTVLADEEGGDCLRPGSRVTQEGLGGAVALLRIQLLANGLKPQQHWDWSRPSRKGAP